MAQVGDAVAPRRDHHRLIRMHIASEAQFNAAIALGAEPLNCIIGLGDQDFSASPGVLQQLRAMGMPFSVLHDDVQALIDADMASIRRGSRPGGDDGGIAGGGEGGDAWFLDYKTYPAISDYLDSLVALRPDLATKLSAGTSLEGRTLHALRITSSAGGPNKPGILITGCQHAREWAAVMTAMYAADKLVRGQGVDPRITALLDRVEFYIIPVVNADGYEFTYAPGGERFWRKNRRDHGGGVFGVDLNRNWGVDWGGPNSTSNMPSSDVYYGTAAFSEPETAAVRDFAIAHPNLIANIDVHSYGQLVLQSWGHTNAENPDYDLIDFVGTAMNEEIASVHGEFYENGWGGSLLYLASGVLPDWMYGVRGMLGYTIEVRDQGATGFALPAAQILPTGQENFPAMLELAERASAGAQFFFPTGVPQAITALSTTTLRVDIRPTPQATLQSSTAKLWWRVGSAGSFAPVAMTNLGGVQYQASLPALSCGQRLEFYVEILNGAGAPLRSPANAPSSAYAAIALRNALTYDFQTVAGWTTSVSGATAGAWQRGVPVNDPNWPYDPRADADGSGSCWLTGNALGNSDVDNGSVLLTSPAINAPSLLNTGERAGIAYAWFLHRVSPVAGDSLKLQVSVGGTGGPYTDVITHNQSGTMWRRGFVSYDQLAALGLTLGSNTAVRLVALDGNPQSIIEAAVDDVRIVADCRSATCAADINDNGAIDVNDLLAVITTWGPCPAPPCAADIAPTWPAGPGSGVGGHGNGAIDINDLLAVIAGWGPCP
ncbi:MAG TPA: M14 family zinc carboxypeptidase [Phycisphaerales bacterium]|nr:M14 family zinc carboxypeptidase [Phycisphaerales bacterium]